jgi:NADPH:quinone reductase-like Zn-dependent oxidoreductase
LTPRGTLVIVGGEGGGTVLGGTDRLLRALLLSPFIRQRLRVFVSAEKAEDLEYLNGLFDAGTVTPTVDRTFPLDEAAAALVHLESGHPRGRVVLTV